MQHQIQIRRARLEDIHAIVLLFEECFPSQARLLRQWDRRLKLRDLQKRIEDSRSISLVAFMDEQPIGVVRAKYRSDGFFFDSFCIHPDVKHLSAFIWISVIKELVPFLMTQSERRKGYFRTKHTSVVRGLRRVLERAGYRVEILEKRIPVIGHLFSTRYCMLIQD